MDPSAIRLFLQTYHAERKRLIADTNSIKPQLEKKLGSIDRQIGRLTDAMIASDAPVTQFTSKIAELNAEKQGIEGQLQDLSKPTTTVSLHPAAQERYLSVVENLAVEIRAGGPRAGMGEVVRDLIELVVLLFERTKPGRTDPAQGEWQTCGLDR